MRIIFLGVGEAVDENHPNTSIFIEEIGLLLDCGFSAVMNVWKSGMHKKIKAVYISHFHADHTFGVPPLLMRWLEESRKDPMMIIGAKGIENHVRSIFSLAYPCSMQKLPFTVSFREIDPASSIHIDDAVLTFSRASHIESSFAVRIDILKKSVVYSGDTGYSEDIVRLAKDADLLIHEAYTRDKEKKEKNWNHHSSFLSAAACASKSGAKKLAIIHVLRTSRDKEEMQEEAGKSYKGPVIIPEDLEEIDI